MNVLKRLFFYFVSFLCHVMAFICEKIRMPFSKKLTDFAYVLKIMGILEKGDFILTRTRGELTTLIIPGYWKHLAIYVGRNRIVHSVSEGVIEDWVPNLIMKTDYFVIRRLKDVPRTTRAKVAEYAKTQIGKLYDTWQRFLNKDKLSCSELGRNSVNYVMGDDYIELRYRLGFPSFTPDDCGNADKKFVTFFEFRKQ